MIPEDRQMKIFMPQKGFLTYVFMTMLQMNYTVYNPTDDIEGWLKPINTPYNFKDNIAVKF